MKTIVFTRLEEYLKGIEYPISKGKIVKYAKVHHVSEDVLEVLQQLGDVQYEDINAIREGLLSIKLDDGIPKKTKEAMQMKKINSLQKMQHDVNPNDFTQMGDEEDHESV